MRYAVHTPPLIDWPEVLAELQALGMSRVEIARAACVPLSTIQHWLAGNCPDDMRHARGQRLLAVLESARARAVHQRAD